MQEIITQANTLKGLHPVYFHGELYNGFCYSLAEKAAQETIPLLDWPLIKKKKGVVVVPSHEIFGRRSNRPLGKSRSSSQAKAHQVDQLLDFSTLVEGDYLVHLQHGICIYRGLKKLNARSV